MKITVAENWAALTEDETLMQNSKKIYTVEFDFDPSWDEYSKTITFKAGNACVIVALTGNSCTIPSDCLKQGGVKLSIGVYGVKGEAHKGTFWCLTSMILYNTGIDVGSTSGSGSGSYSDETYTQLIAAIGDLNEAGFEGKTLAEVLKEIEQSIDRTATDEEVDDALNEIFGSGASTDEVTSNTATDEEVDNMLNAVFGNTP